MREATLRQTLAELEAARTRLASSGQPAGNRVSEIQQEVASMRQDAEARLAAVQSSRQQVLAGQAEIAETATQLAALKQRVNEADPQPAAKVLHHSVTPISKVVTGEELHFRLHEGRVAFVPIEELARRLKADIDRRKEMLAKLPRYEGSVGPVDGFNMEFVIERQELALADQLKFGQQMVRMQVTKWTIVPERNLSTETAEQAMQRGSSFYNALLSAGPTATLTFWVYEDSFSAARKLQDFIHQHGYQVAARPLPMGVPISGSPDGSKSLAQ
jgi:hypothetical protein